MNLKHLALKMALVGVAGTTETGSIDPLNEMADLSEELYVIFTLMQHGAGQLYYLKITVIY